ncbi:MAG: serine protease [Ilumatobacteraceae bacterium]
MHRPPPRRPRRVAAILTVGAAAVAAAVAAGCDDGDDDITDAIVVSVAAQPCASPNRDRGVGVVVGPDLVATAAHVVDGDRRELTVDDRPARVVAVDARTDLALLRADVDGPAATPTDDPPTHGVVRTPDGDQDVDVTRTGRLVVDDTTDGVRHERQVHTFTPGMEPGTSGAPLLDDGGRLTGIVVLTNRTDGTAYAVTAAELRRLISAAPGSPAPSGCPD